jgi:hypothetical protein
VPVALLVVGIGASLGGPTGYAINPARDLGPRIAHAILPIKGKGSSDWSYAWVPVVGPLRRHDRRAPAPAVLLHLAHAIPTRFKGEQHMADYIIALDQGTTSSRAIIFDKKGSIIAVGQKEHEQIMPRAGWVEHDPIEIRDNMREVIGIALGRANLTRHDIAAVGITNQRETAVVWDKNTGIPVYNAIVWQDTRTQPIVDRLAATRASSGTRTSSACRWRPTSRAPRSSGSSRTSRGAREGRGRRPHLRHDRHVGALEPHRRPDGGVHATDVTNASRTLFMDLKTLEWRDDILADFGVPRSMMPEIRSSSEVYGEARDTSLLRETPVAGILGDQQAATFGQAAFDAGESKNTYGTGCFIFQTGHRDRQERERSAHDGRLQARRRARPTTRWRARSPSPDRSSSGCATSSASSPPRPRWRSWPRRSRTTAACTSCPRSRVCSRRTGVPTPAARSSASPATRTATTSPARRSRRPPSRPARCWTRSTPTRASTSPSSRSTAA